MNNKYNMILLASYDTLFHNWTKDRKFDILQVNLFYFWSPIPGVISFSKVLASKFDINKFMSEEQNSNKAALDQCTDPPKRRRVPSEYATLINDFKSVTPNLPRTTPPIIKNPGPTETPLPNSPPSHRSAQPLLVPWCACFPLESSCLWEWW